MAKSAVVDAGPSAMSARHLTEQRIAATRAAVALVWAVALVVAVGNDVPRTDSDVPAVAAALLASYPLIDVVATALSAGLDSAAALASRFNIAVGSLAVVAIGVAAFGSDTGATLIAFGTWAAVSGLLQLGLSLVRRRDARQLSLVISGGVSTFAGLSFIVAAGKTDASLDSLGAYMAAGAILFLIWAYRNQTAR